MIEFLLGAAVAWVSTGAGVVIGRRRRPRPALEKPAVCGCGHARSFHENGTGACGWKEDKIMYGTLTTIKTCGCLHYDGPEPLTTVYAPELR